MKLITSNRRVVRPGIELGMSMRFNAPCACVMKNMAESRHGSTVAMHKCEAARDDICRDLLTLK